MSDCTTCPGNGIDCCDACIRPAAPNESIANFDEYEELGGEEPEICDGCGKPFGEGRCPLCCGHSYAPGSEECDFCGYSDECAEMARLEDLEHEGEKYLSRAEEGRLSAIADYYEGELKR